MKPLFRALGYLKRHWLVALGAYISLVTAQATSQYFCRFHKVAMHGSRPPLAPPVPRGEDRLPPCERGGLRGGGWRTADAL